MNFSLNIHGRLRQFNRPLVMGVVNVTPDSFYGSSRLSTVEEICRRVRAMVDSGADIIDIGGCSTRPGAQPASVAEELSRIELGVRAARSVSGDIMISVDTFRADVARASVCDWGADIINDVSGGDLDERMFETVASLSVPYVLTHSRGDSLTMGTLTDYGDVAAAVVHDLSLKLRRLRLLGVADVIIDPGFGFAKTLEQNYELMRNLSVITGAFGEPVLVGFSRKSMITNVLGLVADDALNGTTVLNTLALSRGAAILRVHDVNEAVQAVRLFTLSNI